MCDRHVLETHIPSQGVRQRLCSVPEWYSGEIRAEVVGTVADGSWRCGTAVGAQDCFTAAGRSVKPRQFW